VPVLIEDVSAVRLAPPVAWPCVKAKRPTPCSISARFLRLRYRMRWSRVRAR